MLKQYTMSVARAQDALCLGRTTLYGLMADGRLQRLKIGRRTLITVSSIEQLIEQASARGAC
jgi:hypothetical protein